MKVTTKVGDKGTTQIGPNEFAPKGGEIVEFYGTIDELQVAIGNIEVQEQELQEYLQQLQRKLFDIYSGKITQEDVDKIENYQKQLQDDPEIIFDWNLTTPQTFPADYARVTARKLERQYYRAEFEQENTALKQFLNRLSDFMWVVGRHIESKPKKQQNS